MAGRLFSQANAKAKVKANAKAKAKALCQLIVWTAILKDSLLADSLNASLPLL